MKTVSYIPLAFKLLLYCTCLTLRHISHRHGLIIVDTMEVLKFYVESGFVFFSFTINRHIHGTAMRTNIAAGYTSLYVGLLQGGNYFHVMHIRIIFYIMKLVWRATVYRKCAF